jgi:hypothetical protein
MDRAMERIFLVYLSLAMIFCWLAGWVAGIAPWLTWSFCAASAVCLVASAFGSRRSTSLVAIGVGLWMLGLWVAALATGHARGLTFFPGALAVLFLVLGGTSAWLRSRHSDATMP